MHFKIKIIFMAFLVCMMITSNLCVEFSAEVGEPSVSLEDESLEDSLRSPQIARDMLRHRNPVITNNALKELWEKLPDYELTDIK